MEKITRVGFGCVALTKQPFLSKAIYLLESTFNEGITKFDTAPVYGLGYSEIILRKFIKNKREKVTLTTKFGLGNVSESKLPVQIALPLNYIRKKFQPKIFGTNNYQKTPNRIITKKQVEHDFYASLKRLNTNYIDCYLLHEGIPSFLTDEARTFIEDLKKNGEILKLGIGICYKNLFDITDEELTNWDILQYENNLDANSEEIYHRFPQKTHVHHSIFRNYTDHANDIIFNHLKKFPKANVLFSSSNKAHIKNNITLLKI